MASFCRGTPDERDATGIVDFRNSHDYAMMQLKKAVRGFADLEQKGVQRYATCSMHTGLSVFGEFTTVDTSFSTRNDLGAGFSDSQENLGTDCSRPC